MALPREDRDPVGVVADEVRRVDADIGGDHPLARAAGNVGERDGGRDILRHVVAQSIGRCAADGQHRQHDQTDADRAGRQSLRGEYDPEHRAACARQDGDGDGHRERFGPHAGRPRVVVDRVDPQRLQPQSDGGDTQPTDEPKDDGPLEQWCQRRAVRRRSRVRDTSANQLIGAPRIGPTTSATPPRSAIASSAAMIAAPRPSMMRAATKPKAPRGGDQHRLEHLAELRYAEVEFDLEHRQADEHTAEAEVLDELDADAVARRVVPHRLQSLMVEHDRGQRGEAGARQSSSDGWAPTA